MRAEAGASVAVRAFVRLAGRRRRGRQRRELAVGWSWGRYLDLLCNLTAQGLFLKNTGKNEGKLGNDFSSKHGAESAQSSAYKKICDPDELEELESKTPPSAEPPRNILLSLRSAFAKQTKPATLPRRSARLVPKHKVGVVEKEQKIAPTQDRTTDLQFTRLTLYH
ncbi:hypothetical protein E2562_026490 [Oryza meyeriana var. granulata]|uniref:Uncharacterized protein n=1 Tax=Oryza meyeriana var. granulata TaxID=110450 RepID=A0A6G1DNK1_9ORYZ|nr:hypothetical protein E2562_026490 [Oryza meyeriana var. granulata]